MMAAPVLRRRTLLVAGLGASLGAPARAQPRPTVLRLSWWGGGARHEATLRALRLFEQRHPGLRIKAEYMGFQGYLERLTTQVAGGTEPDVMQVNWAWLAMFSKRGTGFTDLAPHLPPGTAAHFQPEDLATGTVQGRLNALPVSYTARVFLWNLGTWEKLGLPLPTNWDALFAAGPRFRSALGAGAFPLDGELYDMALLSHAWVMQTHGVPFIAPGAPPRVAMSLAAAVEWVQAYRRLVEGHVATPLPLRASLGGAEKPTEQQPDWVNGRWAGNYTWDSVIALRASTLRGPNRLALGDFLLRDAAVQTGIFGRPALMFAVGRHCKQPALATRLVEFLLTDPEAARVLGRTRGIPSSRPAFEQLLAAGALPALELQAHAQIQAQRQAGRIPLPAPLMEHPRMLKFLREVFELVAYRKTTDEDAARRLVENGQALLRRLA
jgi:oligogalacturonide transport system substrate-binding protein